MNSTRAFIALGANLARKRRQIAHAVELIGNLPLTRIVKVGKLRVTQPVGGPKHQPAYCNTAVEVETGLSPRTLLTALLKIERTMGRDRAGEVKNGPRVIDLDMLLYGKKIMHGAALTLPHPRMHERRFVLDPMCDLAPELVHPVLKKTMRQLQMELKGKNTRERKP